MQAVLHRLLDFLFTGILVEGGSLHIQRWYYRQRMMATLARSQRPWLLAIDSGVFKYWEPWEGEPGSASLEKVEAAATDTETIR